MKIDIPNYKTVKIKNLVLDFNGTLANGGIVKDSTKDLLLLLKDKVDIYVVTADTFGTVKDQLKCIGINYHIISKENGSKDKESFVLDLSKKNTVAIGNGHNDVLMIKAAEIGICIAGTEGCFTQTLLASDIVIDDIDNALLLLLDKNKLIATLRK
jgi:P-type E1-E2 ATPase